MKRPIPTALTAVALCLAMAGQAAAQDCPTAPPPEEAQQERIAEDELQAAAIDATEDAPPDDAPATAIVEEDDRSAASDNEQSEGREIKSELKRMLIGLLLPAVERRIRKTVDSDDDPLASSPEPEPEPESVP